jgi:hypothetical protein
MRSRGNIFRGDVGHSVMSSEPRTELGLRGSDGLTCTRPRSAGLNASRRSFSDSFIATRFFVRQQTTNDSHHFCILTATASWLLLLLLSDTTLLI